MKITITFKYDTWWQLGKCFQKALKEESAK